MIKGEKQDLTGLYINRLTVLEYYGSKQIGKVYKRMWICKCDCGNYRLVPTDKLTSGKAVSCGRCKSTHCGRQLWKWNISELKVDNDDYQRLCRKWYAMIDRCKNNPDYVRNKIAVCEEWQQERESFIVWALSNGYRNGLSIDRIDPLGDYEPANCRWVDAITQANNKTNNCKLEIDGVVHTIAEWSRITGINAGTIRNRYKYGKTGIELIKPVNIRRKNKWQS